MPILAAEPGVFPENLFDGFTKGSPGRLWWGIYTKAQQEKAVARHLLAREIPFYLPLVPKLHLIRGKRIKSLLPLFSSYVFLFSSEEERIGALKTNRVVQMLPVADQQLLLNDLRQIQRLIASNAPLTIEQRLMPGRQVRVKSGVFKGLEGTILDRYNNSRLLVAVNFLQQGVSLAIEDFMVEPID